MVKEIIEAAGFRFAPATDMQVREALRDAIEKSSLGANALERKKNKDALARFSESYLLDEICSVVLARDFKDLGSYLDDARFGRQEPLSPSDRELVWYISRAFTAALARYEVETWSELRAKAARLVSREVRDLSFDAVVVDEVQDLEPSLITMLAALTNKPGNLFLTADSRQSIYRSGFAWEGILSTLGIEAEVAELPGNYRSTEQIDAAAKNYLGEPALQAISERYAFEGPLPIVSVAKNEDFEARLVAQFCAQATKVLHQPRSSCAVLVPTQKRGRELASRLTELGVHAQFFLGRELDITVDAVKVLSFQSAKGLEFPVVMIAGLWPPDYPHVLKGASSAEINEHRAIQRRTLFVAMTRAMRALMLVKPKVQASSLLDPFDVGLWNVRG